VSRRRGIPFVVAAPSGTGKTTVCRALVDADPELVHSVSHTTRAPRQGEIDGVHYHFVSEKAFRGLEGQDVFLEWAEYGGNLYGTSSRELDASLARGVDVLLEIEVQGAAQIRARRDDARLIFLLPPSWEELERRLRTRGADADEVVERRLTIARREILAVREFDYAVVNDDLEETLSAVHAVLDAERHGDTADARTRYRREAALERLGPGFDNLR